MPAWLDNTPTTGALDSMLNVVKNGASNILLVTSYSQGEDYATVTGRSVADASISSGNFTGPAASGNNRILTFTGASATATGNASTPDLHMVITNGSDTILAVSDESTDQDIVSGNTVNFGSFEIRALQPSSVP